MVYQRDYQVPEANVGPKGMPACPDGAQQDNAERNAHDGGGHGCQGVLYGPQEPWPASAVADVSEPSVAVFEHAEFVDLGAGDHREAEVRRLVHERAGEGDKVHEKVGEVVVQRFQDCNLQAFQPVEQ